MDERVKVAFTLTILTIETFDPKYNGAGVKLCVCETLSKENPDLSISVCVFCVQSMCLLPAMGIIIKESRGKTLAKSKVRQYSSHSLSLSHTHTGLHCERQGGQAQRGGIV